MYHVHFTLKAYFGWHGAQLIKTPVTFVSSGQVSDRKSLRKFEKNKWGKKETRESAVKFPVSWFLPDEVMRLLSGPRLVVTPATVNTSINSLSLTLQNNYTLPHSVFLSVVAFFLTRVWPHSMWRSNSTLDQKHRTSTLKWLKLDLCIRARCSVEQSPVFPVQSGAPLSSQIP